METLTKTSAKPVELNEKEVCDKLLAYALERQYAYKIYAGGYALSQKLDAILEIIYMLNQAKACKSPRECLKMILKTALNFHFIAPTKNRKDHDRWYTKIEDCMAKCRQCLGWQKQTCA